MNILITVENFTPPLGGAEYSLFALADRLSKKHNVYIIQPGDKKEVIELDKVKVIKERIPWIFQELLLTSHPMMKALYWRMILDKNIPIIKPELILTQLNFAPPSIDMALKHNIPSIMFIRSYEHFCPIGFIKGVDCDRRCNYCISFKSRLHFWYVDKWLKWNGTAVKNADLVIANSHFVASLTKKWFGIEPSIVYPTITAEKYQCDQELKQYIAIIKPTKVKGADIFLKIAEALPNEKFIAVGGDETIMNKKVIESHKNIDFIEWTNNIEEVYAKTKILLAPAEWPEPFGRVIIEAGINGIPSIASNRGGLPEAVGDGGILIDDIYNIDEWVKAVKSLDDNRTYDSLSKNAMLHAQQFNLEVSYARFKQAVEEKFSFTL